jgi:hypothetical protein
LKRAKETYREATKGKTDRKRSARTAGSKKMGAARRSADAITVWIREGSCS